MPRVVRNDGKSLERPTCKCFAGGMWYIFVLRQASYTTNPTTSRDRDRAVVCAYLAHTLGLKMCTFNRQTLTSCTRMFPIPPNDVSILYKLHEIASSIVATMKIPPAMIGVLADT